ncbi:MAG: sulfate reduction electron transfer complex DsrMKJOP subunit DsrJ, partial [Planctomycetota bacterium]
NHMSLLLEWRDAVVREGKKYTDEVGGKKYRISLVKTCLGCHTDKAAFCDRCHDYADVAPDCWNCHIEPKGTK